MNTTTHLFFVAAFLLITLVFASGCIIAASHDGDITAPLAQPESETIEALYEAARDGDWDRVRDMLEAQPALAKACFRKHDRDTLLHMAAMDGNVKAVKALIGKGAYVNGRNSKKRTPLLYCACNGNVKIARLLIKAGADVKALDKDNNSALHMSALWGNSEIVRLLLPYSRSLVQSEVSSEPKGADIDGLNDKGYSPLHCACMYDHAESAKLLLLYGAKVNNGFDDEQCTPLHWAAANGNDEIVELLIAKSADVNAHELKIDYLYESNSKKDFSKEDSYIHSSLEDVMPIPGLTPLMVANTISTAKILRKHGAKLNKHDVDLCASILFGYVEHCPQDEDVAKMLVYDEIALMVAKGFDINGTYHHLDRDADTTVLHEALESLFSTAGLISCLIEHGADIHVKYGYDKTPLHIAANGFNPEIIELLIEHGADVNATDKFGSTPLDDATYSGMDIAIVETLKKHGAKPGYKLKEEQEAKEDAGQAK